MEVPVSSSRGSSWASDQTHISCVTTKPPGNLQTTSYSWVTAWPSSDSFPLKIYKLSSLHLICINLYNLFNLYQLVLTPVWKCLLHGSYIFVFSYCFILLRWDGWMASPTWWTWVWASSRSWWWTGKPGVLRSMGSQRVTTKQLNRTELTLHGYTFIDSRCHSLRFGSCCGLSRLFLIDHPSYRFSSSLIYPADKSRDLLSWYAFLTLIFLSVFRLLSVFMIWPHQISCHFLSLVTGTRLGSC